MADISFTPTFRHPLWVDKLDKVQASGPNGFNVRFSALESDLRSLSTVIGDVNAALALLGQQPPDRRHVLSLPPTLTATAGAGAWAQDSAGYAVRTGALTSLVGITPVVLPEGAAISSLRVVGQNSGTGALRISLNRASLLGAPSPATRIARVTGDANPFDNTVAADPNTAVVDTSSFRYFVLATLDGANAADIVSLSGFQIAYLAP